MGQHPVIKVSLNDEVHRFRVASQCTLYALLPDTAENKGLYEARVINDTVLVTATPTTRQLNPETLEDFAGLWSALNRDVEIIVPTSIEDHVRTWSIRPPPSRPEDGNGPMLPYTIEASDEDGV
jgi:hypothetical protein